MKQTPQVVNPGTPDKYEWKGNKKQKLAMSLWIEPTSETFGNAYKSFKLAGFSESYSKNIVGQAPKWISEYLDRTFMTVDHIEAGIQQLAIAAPKSRSEDDTRLKAYETLAKIRGMIDNKNGGTTVNIVQPILNGESIKPPIQTNVEVINKDNKPVEEQLNTSSITSPNILANKPPNTPLDTLTDTHIPE